RRHTGRTRVFPCSTRSERTRARTESATSRAVAAAGSGQRAGVVVSLRSTVLPFSPRIARRAATRRVRVPIMTASVSSGRAPLSAIGVSLTFAIALGALSSCDGSSGSGLDPGLTAGSLRSLIVQVVGDPEKLRVPATDDALPQPLLPNGAIDPAFA